MHQSLARYSAPVSLVHAPSWADFITTMVGFKVFGTHTGAGPCSGSAGATGPCRFPVIWTSQRKTALCRYNDRRRRRRFAYRPKKLLGLGTLGRWATSATGAAEQQNTSKTLRC